MKYIVLTLEKDGLKRELPILFPSCLSHKEVADALKAMRVEHGNGWKRPLADAEAVSAGFLNSAQLMALDSTCFGRSESLGVESRGDQDSALITECDFTHGIVPDADASAEEYPEAQIL